LNNKRDDVTGAEYPEVELRREDGTFWSKDFDETTKEDIDTGCIENRGYYERMEC